MVYTEMKGGEVRMVVPVKIADGTPGWRCPACWEINSVRPTLKSDVCSGCRRPVDIDWPGVS